VRSGNKEETVFLGKGNGDGIANPGESIVVLVKDQGKLWRTELACSDRFINPFGINIRKSDYWGDLDHVGGSAKYSVPLIASDCPAKHEVRFIAEYWVPEYPNHIIKQGMVKVGVEGQDKTSPFVKWIKIPGNIIQARIIDGGKVASVKAKLASNPQAPELSEAKLKDPQKTFDVELNDEGRNGDVKAGDNVFSAKIPEQKFYVFSVKIEAVDEYGNSMSEEYPENFIVY